MTDRGRSGNPLWIAYELIAMVIGLGSLAIICLGWMPFAMLLKPLLPRRIGQPLGRRMIAGGFRFYLGILETFCACRFHLAELDRLRDSGPLILAANHPSLLDAVMITSRLPNAVCVMKAALMDNLLFGAAARLARYIRNDAPLDMILNSRQALDEGAHLVIFPEGTRTSDFPLDPLHADDRPDRQPIQGGGADLADRIFDSLSGQGLAAFPPASAPPALPYPAWPSLRSASRRAGFHPRAGSLFSCRTGRQ